jgi:hypothetical protein
MQLKNVKPFIKYILWLSLIIWIIKITYTGEALYSSLSYILQMLN